MRWQTNRARFSEQGWVVSDGVFGRRNVTVDLEALQRPILHRTLTNRQSAAVKGRTGERLACPATDANLWHDVTTGATDCMAG